MLLLGVMSVAASTTAMAQSGNPSAGYSPISTPYNSGTSRYRPSAPPPAPPSNIPAPNFSQYGSASRPSPPSATPTYTTRSSGYPSGSATYAADPSHYDSSALPAPYGYTEDRYGTLTNEYGAEPVRSPTGEVMPKRYIGGGRIGAQQPTFWGMATDLFLVRPLTLVTTAAGSVGFVVSLPFSLTAGNTDVAAEKFVLEPARNTFTRPLGTSWDNPDPPGNH
jgi:hypothetical protein